MATQYLQPPVTVGGGYTYQIKRNPDGSAGIDYFDPQGNPITNTVFNQSVGPGLQVNEQNSIPDFLQQAHSSPGATQLAPQGAASTFPQGSASNGQMDGPFLPGFNSFDITQPSGGGAGGTGGTSNTQIYGNQQYDLNDPQQRLAYYQAVATNLGTQRDQALQAAQNAFRTNDQQSVNQYQQYLSTLDQNLADVQAAAQGYVQNYNKTLNGFNEQKGQGDVNRANYFGQISPNAFQSSQSSSQQYANDKYNQGLGDLTNQLNSNVGLNYYNNFDNSNPSADPLSNLDSGSTYGRQVGSIGTQRTGLQNSFDTYRQGAQQNLQTTQNNIYDQYNQGLASNAQQLGQVDVSQGTNPFQYGVQTVTPSQVAAPDLSQYTPYTNFQSLSNPSAQGSAYVPANFGNNAFSQNSLDTYLNRSNTTLPAGTTSNSWAAKYLNGKITT